ncbi:aspartate/glutamate racemase family protein [Novosphingobium beihaiensis]|uniref:Aspartate/glutamate racemase family protein n=1 Tax=Novosphingobium beihaiensis TaxID=2930389 RepID=A0ABT0BQV0_9SPHN|nr:aspartate/glutamate racemase family protein [Novosphingobium beihaiensis]MCJ2187429.1 aspartate/glutamate racemase family protein [Novosphingobium beihaiensis]
MKTIGLIGGMSWESSAEYYRIINRAVRDRLGPEASAQCLLWSFDFAEIAALQRAGDWPGLTERMIDAARRLEAGGAEMLLICTNTMHRMADEVQTAVPLPLLHIADAAGAAIARQGLTRVGLLGTAFTMEQPFYRERLRERFGLDVIVPEEANRAEVHRVIYEELIAGRIEPTSRQTYRDVIARLVDRGAQGVILGCTEIPVLVSDTDAAVPLFDTTRLHAEAAVGAALDS